MWDVEGSGMVPQPKMVSGFRDMYSPSSSYLGAPATIPATASSEMTALSQVIPLCNQLSERLRITYLLLKASIFPS
jgi:hypothetical protein